MKTKKVSIIKSQVVRSIICILLTFNFQLFLTLSLSMCTFNCFSQGIAINTTGARASSSALLDISDSGAVNPRGLLIPRVSLTDVNDYSPLTGSPVISLLVYSNTAPIGGGGTGFYYWDGKWVNLAIGSGWQLTGNAGTDSTVNFIGTTDAKPLVIKTGGNEKMRVMINGNIGIGTTSPSSSALLDLNSITKGTLITRMNTAQRDNIATACSCTPATGLIIYNTDCNNLNYYNGTTWVTVNNITTGVSITASPAGAICSGTSVTFTATPVNGGTSPTYQWSKNNSSITGATNSTYTNSSLTNGDVITCAMTSNAACVTGSPAISNNITVTVNPIPLITDMTATVCGGTAFNVMPVNAMNGVVPAGTTYTWTAPEGTGFTGGTDQTTPQPSIGQILTNTTTAPVSATYTVTPVEPTCIGSTFTVTVTVNPVPTVAMSPSTQTVCSGIVITSVILSNPNSIP